MDKPESKKSSDKISDCESAERISVDVSILKDGTTIVGDVPSELLNVLNKLYPDNPDLKQIVQNVKREKS